jgi:N-acetylglucosaminyldiphosphoundecaprenol N-acetyl-beta-D-mannosaminyltransferase
MGCRANVLGVGISPLNLGSAVETIEGWIERREHHYVCVTPAHAVMDAYGDPDLRRVFNSSGLTTPDGMAIVWLLRMMGHPHVGRVYGPDLMLALFGRSVPTGYRHFLYGGEAGVAEELATRLRERFPGLRIAGTYTPPFRPLTAQEDSEVVTQINASGADLVWVGLSSPKQERWMASHLGAIEAPVMIGVGAAFDFLSGRKSQAPRWIQRSGFEWLFRLASEPRRLWPRYRRYPKFVCLALSQLLGLKHFPMEGE